MLTLDLFLTDRPEIGREMNVFVTNKPTTDLAMCCSKYLESEDRCDNRHVDTSEESTTAQPENAVYDELQCTSFSNIHEDANHNVKLPHTTEKASKRYICIVY